MKKTLWFILVFSVGVVTEDADADFTFGEAVNLGATVNSPAHDMCPRISTDGLSLFFTSARPGGLGGIDAYVATRPSIDAPWLAPVNLGPTVNSSADEHSLSLSADGLTLYFMSKRAGGFGRGDLWLTTRTTIDDPWGTPENLGSTVNSPDDELALGISTDGLSLTFTSNRAGGSGGYDLWRTTRATTSDPWGAPVNLGPTVNSSDNEYTLGVSPDDRTLYFSSDRPGVEGWINLWVTRRATLHDDWSEPVPLGPGVNGPSVDGFPVVSTDGQTLYWSSKRDGGAGLVDLWQMPILPVVDFNGDYNVGIEDLLLLIEHWGQNEPSVDIAPGPWGDGSIDAADLEVFMGYWGHELDDPALLAYWKLDETEGAVAYDSGGENDATVVGDALWQAAGGQVEGALQLDGIDDYLAAPFILDPTKQPFSVSVWIKDGRPLQTILSQQGAFGPWLSVDPAGAVSTGLTFPLPAITSSVIVTDGQWHHVGLASDGSGISLYVDDAEVARADRSPVLPAQGGLQIGAGTNLEPDAFWSGLVDDLRISSRVIVP